MQLFELAIHSLSFKLSPLLASELFRGMIWTARRCIAIVTMALIILSARSLEAVTITRLRTVISHE